MKVVELYSGIGGMQFALKGSSIGSTSEVVLAVDLNTVCNEVYKHNFPGTNLLNRNMSSLSAKEINSLAPDMILMSPPCQPFTRLGKRKDMNDARNSSFLHCIKLIPELSTVKFIIMENVQGFEVSETRQCFLNVLKISNFIFEEYLLNSRQFGSCNSRLRYYMLAKKSKEIIAKEPQIITEVPEYFNDILESIKIKCKLPKVVSQVLEYNPLSNEWNARLLPLEILKKYYLIMDAVSCDSSNSCCFTRGYARFFEGTGSLLSDLPDSRIKNIEQQIRDNISNDEMCEKLLRELKLRCFTPREIARLMSFPEEFSFPGHISEKQRYKLICNSINVFVVSVLISYLTTSNSLATLW